MRFHVPPKSSDSTAGSRSSGVRVLGSDISTGSNELRRWHVICYTLLQCWSLHPGGSIGELKSTPWTCLWISVGVRHYKLGSRTAWLSRHI